MTDYAAVDLGATSGRVVRGSLDGGRVELEEVHRFDNRPVRLPDGLRWNLLHLFTETLTGLRRAGELAGVGVDTWGVDYALLDGEHRVLGLPFHYRDDRTDGMIERAFERVPAERLYAAAGIQTMPINTVFQLLADEGSAALEAAQRIALVPDLLALWLCGELANERTNASTTGLLDARSGEWATEVIGELGLPERLFGPLAEPGTELGPLLGHHDLGDTPVYAVASHDTASAFAAVPVDEHAAVLSSGTWSLLGLELPEPVLSDAARDATLTNERGIDGTTRLLKNVMGLWLLEESRRCWGDTSLRRAASSSRRKRNRTFRCSTPTPTSSCAPATCPPASPPPASAPASPLRTASARPCAASSSRSPASTAGRWSGSRRSAAATCAAST